MDKSGKVASVAAVMVAVLVIALAVFAAPTTCNDKKDNDGDGLKDYPSDPGCSSKQDSTETSSALICDDGIDESNDADNLADYRLTNGDPGCRSASHYSEVDGECDNLYDDDGDGFTDYPNDPGCTSYHDQTEGAQPQQ